MRQGGGQEPEARGARAAEGRRAPFPKRRRAWPFLPWLAAGAVAALCHFASVGILGCAVAAATAALLLGPLRPFRARSVEELADILGLLPVSLRAFAPTYRVARIPKRSGGVRVLHVPDDATKRLQRTLLRRLLGGLRAHDAAYGFERGRSIAHAAAQHVDRAVVLHLDVENFFGTTHAGRIERMFARLGWDAEAAALLARLTTHAGGLPQGAPTSPRLSNLVNAGLDRALTDALARLQARYTRYADDVVVSFPEDWRPAVRRAESRVRAEFGRRGYRIHARKKRSVRRRHQRQEVLGLVVNAKVALPRAQRRRLRAVHHHLATGRASTLTAMELAGWDSFAAMVAAHGAAVPPPFVRAGRPSCPDWRP